MDTGGREGLIRARLAGAKEIILINQCWVPQRIIKLKRMENFLKIGFKINSVNLRKNL